MAVAVEELRERPVVVEESLARRVGRFATRLPIHLLLLFVGLMWLLPTFALFMTSLMTPEDYNSFGWWKLLSKPSLATWDNYSNLWHESDIPHAADASSVPCSDIADTRLGGALNCPPTSAPLGAHVH